MSCQCELAGWCERRQARMPKLHHAKCRAGNMQAIDDLYLRPLVPQRAQSAVRIQRTKYGNKLADIIAHHTGQHVDCSGCDNEIARLNTMTAEQIRGDIETITDGILTRGRTKARTWWQRWACAIAPELLRSRVTEWIREATDGPAVVTDEPWGCDIRHLTYHIWPTVHQDS